MKQFYLTERPPKRSLKMAGTFRDSIDLQKRQKQISTKTTAAHIVSFYLFLDRKDGLIMYYIKKEDWEKIPNDYKSVSIQDPKIKCCFSCFVTPDKSGGTTLLFEHIHFEIV